MKGKVNWMKKFASLLLCAALLFQCGVFAMPSALAEESEAPAKDTLCETCGADPCTCDDEPTLCETCGEAICVCESEATPTAEDYSDSVNKYARLNDYYSDGYVFVHDGSDSFAITSALFFEYAEFEEGLTFLITDWYLDSVNSALWYQVEAYEGTLPEGMSDGYWILQNYTNENADEDTLLFVASEETDEPEIPSVEALVTDSEGNELTDNEGDPITVTVSGEALPEGAEVVAAVPTVNGELLEGVYDIKVLVGGTEWQPVDEGKTVTVTIPVDTDKECIGVLHFIEHADAIGEDEMVFTTEDFSAEDLAILQPAIDAYGDGVNVAVELIPVVQIENGVAVFVAESFSVYTPEYEDQGEDFTVTFTSADGTSDPANEKTYYATIDQAILFTFVYDGLMNKQSGSYSLTRLSDGSDIAIDETEESYSWSDGTWTESVTITFSDELGIELNPGDLFELTWTSGKSYKPKNPRWTRVMIVDECDVTFNTNGGAFADGSTELKKTIVSYQPVDMVEEPTRPGYVFTGWGTTQDSAGGGTVYTSADNFPATLANETEFYAQWKPMQYTVTYVVPDNAINKDLFGTQTKYHDVDLALLTNIPVVDDNTVFQGWDVDGDGAVDISPEVWKAGYTYTGNANLTLVSIWDDAVFSIIYDANGGSGAPDPQYIDTSVTANQEDWKITIPDQIPVYPGRVFTGWKLDDGSAIYIAGEEVAVSGNLVFRAQWEVIAYTIAFNGNGSTSGSMSNMENLYYDDSYANLTANAYEKTSYSFQGWSLTGDGTVQYANGENVKVSALVDSAVAQGLTDSTITLYAVWAQSTYKIVYQAADGDDGVSITNLSQTVIYEMAGKTIINSSATRSRYTFAGWEDEDGNVYENGVSLVPIPLSGEDGATIILTATWEMNIVGYICYMNDGTPVLSGTVTAGEFTDPDNPVSYVTIKAVPGDAIPDMVFAPAEGYRITRILFEGEEQDISSLVVTDGTYTHFGFEATDPYYVAVITEKIPTYTVTWQNYDGTVLETDENVPEGTEPGYNGENPTRSETAQYTYKFSGWTPKVSPVTGDITYTAVYTEEVRKYTITWANYDGTKLKTDEVAYGGTPVWTGANPTYSTTENGYTWIGWDPEITEVTGATTYTATYTVWSTITWANWDGTVLETDERVGTSVLPTYDSATPTRPADAQYTYSFTGWNPSVDLATQHVTYTAQYSTTTNGYTVTWKNEDGTVLETDENVLYGSTPTYDGSAPVKASDAQVRYTFAGWNPTVSVVTGDITYTATYNTEEHIVSVTITWSDLAFIYTPGEWDPQTHTYAEGSFSPENATVTVENSKESTINVKARIEYVAAQDFGNITAQFSIGKNGEKAGTAERKKITPGNSVVFYLWLSGRVGDLSQGNFTSGTCTVTITVADSS